MKLTQSPWCPEYPGRFSVYYTATICRPFTAVLVALLFLAMAAQGLVAAENPRLKMATTLGDITLELDAEKAPISTMNFIQYANDKFYDGTVFHRVMSTFMIQGGGFTPDIEKKTEGMRPGIKNEWENGLKNKRGTIAMARLGGQADSATAQFFINVVDNNDLDVPRDGAGYAVFGKVVEGMDTVDKIKSTKVATHPNYTAGGPVVPVTPVVIQSVRLLGEYDTSALEAMVKAAGEEAANALTAALEEGKAFLEKNRTEPGVKETASGLQYKFITETDGPKPSVTDEVTVHYSGKLLSGREFDSSYRRNMPVSFPLNRVIPGWTEGVQLMSPGSKIQLFIPSELAYGEDGFAGAIPPHSTLIFEIELIEIK